MARTSACSYIWASVVKNWEKQFFGTKWSIRELRFSGNMYFSYTENLASAKVEIVLSLQRNDKKVTLSLIYLYLWLLRKVLYTNKYDIYK